MFSQKRRSDKWIYGSIIAVLSTIIILGAIAFLGGYGDERAARVNSEKNASDMQNTEDSQADRKTLKKKTFYPSYYLVKYDKNVVKIYFSDETGNLTELEDTSIVYETLASQDQEEFRNGIRVSNREELNKLIMDYES